MKKLVQNIKIGIFMGMLIMPSLVWYGVKALAPDVYLKWDYDLNEKRTKEEFPKTFDIENYMQLLEAYYNDNLPFRGMLISMETKLSGMLESVYTESLQIEISRLMYGDGGDITMDISEWLAEDDSVKEPEPGQASDASNISSAEHIYECTEESTATCLENGTRTYICKDCGDSYTEVIPATGHDYAAIFTQEPSYTDYGYTEYECTVCGEVHRDDFVGKLIDNNYFAPRIVGKEVILGRSNWLFYAGDDSLEYYKGINLLEQEQMESHLALMEQLQTLCDEKGIQLQFMIIPNREQIYSEYMPTYEIENDYKRVDRFVDYVHGHSDVNIIYPFQELKKAGLYWQTYYQYDTHWNHLGAFIGVQALYENIGIPATNPHDVDIVAYPANMRDLIALGELDETRYPADEDYFINYKPEIEITYAEGDKTSDDVYRAYSNSENEQNLVFLGDSFRLLLVDYLTKDFSYSVIAHRKCADELSESIREADVLVISAVERYDNEIFTVIEEIIKILQEDA